MESICATRESVEGSHFITSVCFYLVGCTVRVRLSTLILSFFAAESRDTSLTRFSLCVPICHTAHLHHMTEFGLRKACGGARRHQPLWETPRRSEWSYRSGFSNIYPFSPYVTPHSPHVSEFNSFFSSEDEMEVWREGMRQMAKFRHVFVKLSMMGYAVPGWTADGEKEELVKQVCCPPSVDPPPPQSTFCPPLR